MRPCYPHRRSISDPRPPTPCWRSTKQAIIALDRPCLGGLGGAGGEDGGKVGVGAGGKSAVGGGKGDKTVMGFERLYRAELSQSWRARVYYAACREPELFQR